MLRALLLVFGLVVAVPDTSATESIRLSTVDVVKVYDGDTLTVNLSGLYPVFGYNLSVRIVGIDTPELASNCATPELKALEKAKAEQARDVVRDLVTNGKDVTLSELDRDKYFRLLARVSIDGIDVGEALIQKGLAIPYDGGTKTSWCGR